MLGFRLELQGGMSPVLLARRRALDGFPFPGETLTSLRAAQWYVDDLPVSGETGAAYTVRVQDIGKSIRCGDSKPVTVWHPRDIPQVASMRVAFTGVYNSNSPLTPATDGQTVIEWRDVSTGVPASQTTGNQQPIYQENGFGSGLPALKFDGANDRLLIHNSELGFLTGKKYALAIIGFQDTSSTFASEAWPFGYHNGGALALATASSLTGSSASSRVDNLNLLSTAPVPSTHDVQVFSGEVDCINGKLALLINGVEATSAGTSVSVIGTTPNSGGIGNSGIGSVPCNCKVSCYITLADSTAKPPAKDLNRLHQFVGLCSGINLGLPVI